MILRNPLAQLNNRTPHITMILLNLLKVNGTLQCLTPYPSRLSTIWLKTYYRHFNTSQKIAYPRSTSRVSILEVMTRRFGRYDLVRPTSLRTGVAHIQQRSVPETIHRPEYANTGIPDDTPVDEIQCKTPQDIKHMREACQLAAKALDYAQSLLKIGLTTDELDKAVHQWICDHGAYPSPLNYRGFPKSICTSISNVIAHGIPDDRPLKNGDIINIDITVYFNGFHGDTSATFLIGEVDELGRLLVEATHKALDAAIQTCGPNQPFYLIGNAIW
jgi:methionyl aminopeptidase